MLTVGELVINQHLHFLPEIEKGRRASHLLTLSYLYLLDLGGIRIRSMALCDLIISHHLYELYYPYLLNENNLT